MRDRFVRYELEHTFELRNGAIIFRILFENDSEIEPSVRNGGFLLLSSLEFTDSFFRFSGAMQGKPVVHTLADRIGSKVERLAKLLHGVRLRSRILVERLA